MAAVKKSVRVASTPSRNVKYDGENLRTNFYPLKLTFLCSLLAWPITFVYNNGIQLIDQTVRPFWMMVLGFLILASVAYGVSKISKIKDWLVIGIVILTFSSMINLISTLELLGVVNNFMSEYLKYGEPYLFCSWGTGISIYDAIGFFIMYHLIVFFMTNGKSWKSIGIYWGAGFLNSKIVLLLGAIVGQVYTPTLCILLNIPFGIFPIFVLIRAFGTEKRSSWNSNITSSLLLKLVDLGLALSFIASIWVILAKGLVAFGCRGWPVWDTVYSEPALFLEYPAPFAIIQVIVYFFYIIPVQCISTVYLFKKEKPQFLWETTVIHAGIMMQGQFTYLFQCLSTETPPKFQTDWNDSQLWILNLLIVIVPHLFLLRLWSHRQTEKVSKILKKK